MHELYRRFPDATVEQARNMAGVVTRTAMVRTARPNSRLKPISRTADDEQKEYCTVSLDTADDKKKALEHSIAGLETSITKTEDAIAATKEEIGALEDVIKVLDTMLAEATRQRKEEKQLL